MDCYSDESVCNPNDAFSVKSKNGISTYITTVWDCPLVKQASQTDCSVVTNITTLQMGSVTIPPSSYSVAVPLEMNQVCALYVYNDLPIGDAFLNIDDSNIASILFQGLDVVKPDFTDLDDTWDIRNMEILDSSTQTIEQGMGILLISGNREWNIKVADTSIYTQNFMIDYTGAISSLQLSVFAALALISFALY